MFGGGRAGNGQFSGEDQWISLPNNNTVPKDPSNG